MSPMIIDLFAVLYTRSAANNNYSVHNPKVYKKYDSLDVVLTLYVVLRALICLRRAAGVENGCDRIEAGWIELPLRVTKNQNTLEAVFTHLPTSTYLLISLPRSYFYLLISTFISLISKGQCLHK